MSAAQDSPQPALTLRVGGQALNVEAGRIYVIGSGERADLRVVHETVDPYHAVFSYQPGKATIEDSGSRHGTFVDGVRVQGLTELRPGSELRVGEIRVETGHHVRRLSPSGLVVPSPLSRFEHSFGELMAEELHHAPWLMLSLLLHAAAALLLWLILDTPDPVFPDSRVVGVTAGHKLAEEEFPPDAPNEPIEVEQLEVEVEDLPEPTFTAEAFEAERESFEDLAPPGTPDIDGTALLKRIGGRGQGGDDILNAMARGGGSTRFRRTVAGLRKIGLEMVFVFDSSGSMGPVLDATKARITRLLEATQALVPDLRIGVVTYCDHGAQERYVTRSVPLDRDLFRAINFTQTVVHGGGGDHPEAVYDGLKVAIEQDWGPRARRVIVLVGDAPAHPSDDRKLAQLLRDFTRNGQSQVHAIMTTPDPIGGIYPETQRSFRMIANAGGGICLPFEREETILDQVLTLAIGKDFRAEVNEVFAILASSERPIPPAIRDAVRRADQEAIDRRLHRQPVEPELVIALVQSRSLAIAQILIRTLSANDVPSSARQAAAFALKQMLDLRLPPIDTQTGERISNSDSRHLWRLARDSGLQ